jgi:hypothetical protein
MQIVERGEIAKWNRPQPALFVLGEVGVAVEGLAHERDFLLGAECLVMLSHPCLDSVSQGFGFCLDVRVSYLYCEVRQREEDREGSEDLTLTA